MTGNVTGVNFTATELPRISITALDANATEGGDTATFRITRTGSNVSALTIRVRSFHWLNRLVACVIWQPIVVMSLQE